MDRHISSFEEEGAKYGIKLNRSKCEVVVNEDVNVHLGGGCKVKRTREATYLGHAINSDRNMGRELS